MPRAVPSLADQSQRGRVLVYGGWQENGVRNDTWEWDGVGWILRHPLRDPGRRAGSAMVYDERHGRAVLYGGAAQFFPEPKVIEDRRTWEWDGNDWSSFTTAHTPLPTMAPASAWDPSANRVLVFGGVANIVSSTDALGQVTASAAGTDELWAFDGIDWVQIPRVEPWPSPRGLSSMAWDRTRNRLVLHSGQRQAGFANGRLTLGGEGTLAQALGDTWEFDGASWTAIEAPAGIQAGSANLFWDAVVGEVRMVADEVVAAKPTPTLRRYTGAAWELVGRSEQAQQRVVTSSVYSTRNRQALVFGGVLMGTTGLPNSDVSLLEELAGPTFTVLPAASQLVSLTYARRRDRSGRRRDRVRWALGHDRAGRDAALERRQVDPSGASEQPVRALPSGHRAKR